MMTVRTMEDAYQISLKEKKSWPETRVSET
jgi:hypothetical protein